MSYFLPFQSAWVKDAAPLRICVKSRQVGLSYADSYDSVRKAAAKGAKDVWVVSRDENQARQYIRYCRRWTRVLGIAAEEFGENIVGGDERKPVSAQSLALASGARIFALSSNPDAIAGKTGHVKLDEFALHKDQRTLYAVAKPVTQWGGTLSVISTHRGAGTVFNRILTDIKERGNPMGWSLHEVPVQRAVSEGLVEKIDQAAGGTLTAEYTEHTEGGPVKAVPRGDLTGRGLREWWLARQRSECIDQEQWLQEYCCIPADESSAFLSFDLIRACEDSDCLRSPDYLEGCEHPLYLGVDIARKRDLCVLDVGEQIGDVMWDRLRLELSGRTFAQIKAELYRLLRLPRMRRCCIDATGLGMQIAEEAKAEFGWRVEPITFTAAVKEDLAFGLRRDFEERRLRLPPDDRLQADLRGLKKEVTLSGNIRFAGESEDSHCDRTWAKALRQHAARGRAEARVWAVVG